MTDSDAATLIRHIVSREATTPTQAMARLGDERTQTLMACALSVALERKFPQGVSREDIAKFAVELQTRFPSNAEEIKPIVVEALIRTIEGEGGLLNGIDRDDLMSMEYLMTYAIISQELLSPERLDDYIDEVLEMEKG